MWGFCGMLYELSYAELFQKKRLICVEGKISWEQMIWFGESAETDIRSEAEHV